MTLTTGVRADPASTTSPRIFRRVLVGVDGSKAGFEACRQAVRLAEPSAPIELVAVVHLAETIKAGMNARWIADELQEDAERALDDAVQIVGDRAVKRFVNGYVVDALLREVDKTSATVLVVGSHGHRRMTEILIGGVAGELLHRSTCSMLVARAGAAPFPHSIVVGFDGSPEAERALAVGEELAERFHVPLRAVVARHEGAVDLERVHSLAPFAEHVDEHPLPALLGAADDAGLLIVGSRGLHGLRALGSVSERVAHQAACSVLVVHPERPR